MAHFGRYQLLQPLGRTPFAELFLAESPEFYGSSKEVVIETLLAALSQDRAITSTFIADAAHAIAVRHPNVAQLYDFGAVDGTFFVSREKVFGCSMANLLALKANTAGLSEPIALVIAQEILAGLDAVHHARAPKPTAPGAPQAARWHGSLYPGAVLVSAEGAIKLTNLGTATLLLRHLQSAPGEFADLLGYLAPEQLLGEAVDARCDVFSCGVMLWEMLTGRPVYAARGETPDLATRLQRAREALIEPPSRHNPNISHELEDLVMGALAREPAWRFASAKDFSRLIFTYLLRHHPEASLYVVQEYLETHGAQLPTLAPTEVVQPTPHQLAAALSELAVSAFTAPTGLSDMVEAFHRNPRLWLLVEMGDIYRDSAQDDAAVAVYRVAAVLFAQRGLLAHSLLCCKRLLSVRAMSELQSWITALPRARQADVRTLHALCYPSEGPVEHLLQEMLAQSAPAHGLVGVGTPLLSYLSGQAFAAFSQQAPLRAFADSARIVQENEAGSTMYLLGRGRVVVYTRNAQGEPAYLSSLTVGDFFGENSFFTGAPRSATVEALGDVEAFEIDRELYERVMGDNAQAEAALLDFYKERIVNAVLAKNQVFGLLPGEERQALSHQFALRVFKAGAEIIREGDVADSIFLVKAGEAEVFTSKGGPRVSLSSIGPGTLFGEVAALRNIPRTASVVAKTNLEALELAGRSFHAVVAARPELQQRVAEVIARRARDNMDKVFGGPVWRRS